ncbi:MAG: TVP38/TMEM64 family protein [Coriobacteriales bacterium]|nr:TVP38/TMEM64 family protein [Coriobacteriales bacterium]
MHEKANVDAVELIAGKPADQPGSSPATHGEEHKASQSKANKLKFIGLVVFLLLTIGVGIYAIVFFNSMGEGTLSQRLEEAINQAGVFGVLIAMALQFVQIVVAFIPGEVVQVVIGWAYGTVGGGLITLLGAALSSAFVFWVVRKLGAPFVQAMIGSKDNKLLRFIRNGKRLNATVFILYLIPGLPKDVFNYLVPLSNMRLAEFLVLSTIARAPAIFASTFVATAFKTQNYLGMAIVAVIFGGLGVIGIIFNQKIMTGVDKILAKVAPHRHVEKDSDD